MEENNTTDEREEPIQKLHRVSIIVSIMEGTQFTGNPTFLLLSEGDDFRRFIS